MSLDAEFGIMHEKAYVIVAYVDTVGIACDEDCASAVTNDLNNDTDGMADAGAEPATHEQVAEHRWCMGCGELI